MRLERDTAAFPNPPRSLSPRSSIRSRCWRPSSPRTGKVGALAFLSLLTAAASADAQDDYLLKTGRQQALRDLNFTTPFGDQQLEQKGNTIVQGDFDGDGNLDTARRGSGEPRWSTTLPSFYIDDLLPFFISSELVTAVGDFNGDLRDEIAWRLNGCPFWVVDDPTGDHYVIYDGVTGLTVATPFMSVEVGDFDCDGKDEIAWRHAAWTGWAISDATDPVRVIWDDLGSYNPLVSAQCVGDFDNNGCDDIAWRNPNQNGWHVNTLDLPLWSLPDDFGEGFDPELVLYVCGDFDDNGADDIAWRESGSSRWKVNSDPTMYFIDDFFSDFDPSNTKAVTGDFDGDEKTDIAYREKGWIEWVFQNFNTPVGYLPDSPDDFDPQFPVHVGDFNGDGKDDVAWLPPAKENWEVDTEGPLEGPNPFRWQETTEGLEISYEVIYTDVDGDGELNDLVIMVKNPDDSAFLIHKPLMQAYFAKSQGMTITDAWYEGLSPAQKQTFFNDCMASPELQSTFSISPDPGNDLDQFNQGSANGNFESMTEMYGEAEYVLVGDIVETGQFKGQARIIDFDASGVYEANGAGGEVDFTVGEIDYNFDNVISGNVVALEGDANVYCSTGGFSIGAGATLVGADGDFGNPEGSHVSLGVGFGVGAGVGGSWGENDLYGAEIDIKFFSVGVYVKGEDAEKVFQDGVAWCVQAGNDIADWGENAWNDATEFFKNAGDEFVGGMESAFNGLKIALDKTGEGFQFLGNTFEKTATVATKEVENFATNTWDTVSTGTTNVIDDIGDTAEDIGGFVVNTWNSIF